jgi:hypothetical protein
MQVERFCPGGKLFGEIREDWRFAAAGNREWSLIHANRETFRDLRVFRGQVAPTPRRQFSAERVVSDRIVKEQVWIYVYYIKKRL